MATNKPDAAFGWWKRRRARAQAVDVGLATIARKLKQARMLATSISESPVQRERDLLLLAQVLDSVKIIADGVRITNAR